MAEHDQHDPAQDEDDELDLSDEIAKKWDPERLLRLVAAKAGKGERLDEATRSKYERKLGVDLSRVRIYTGAFAEEVNRRHGAEAVTIGNTGMILMGGLSDRAPTTGAGRALLAHELTHVAQAQRGMHFAGADQPLATEEHEQEAQAAEQEELSGSPQSETEGDKKKSEEKMREALKQRVLEKLAEDDIGHLIRNGEDHYLP